MQQQAEEDVLRVSQTLDRLLALDTVLVELIPEKKGLFLKHVEYQVTSQVRNIAIMITTKTTFIVSNLLFWFEVKTELLQKSE